MQIHMKISKTIIALSLIAASTLTHADFFGTLSGRSANPADSPALSVEGSFSFSSDYENIGARVNYNVNETITVYGDFGLSDIGEPDGNSFGVGLFYYLPVLEGYDSAVQASFHTASLDTGSFDTDVTAFGGAFLVTPQTPLNPDTGLNWYANVGLTLLSIDIDVPFFDGFGIGSVSASDDSTELQIGGGVYMPYGPGTIYGGADLIDEFIVGIGYRYAIQ